jgi:type I restriction enzyme M protein
MLNRITKQRIDTCRDLLVGQLPLPSDQINMITLALVYKLMDDMDRNSLAGAEFFVDELAHCYF